MLCWTLSEVTFSLLYSRPKSIRRWSTTLSYRSNTTDRRSASASKSTEPESLTRQSVNGIAPITAGPGCQSSPFATPWYASRRKHRPSETFWDIQEITVPLSDDGLAPLGSNDGCPVPLFVGVPNLDDHFVGVQICCVPPQRKARRTQREMQWKKPGMSGATV